MSARRVDVLVMGGGPAGTAAALRAADLGARTALVTRDAFGGMAANDGPVPVRALAQAARLLREARQLGHYGIAVGEASLDYQKLVKGVRDIVAQAAATSTLRPQIDRAGVDVCEYAGAASFVDANTVGGERCPTFHAKKIVICVGGVSRRLRVPGAELTVTPADALGLTSVPRSAIVIGAGATGVQVASIFNAFGTAIQLFQTGPRIIPTEDEDVSRLVATAFREDGIAVHENFGTIERFEPSVTGVKMVFISNGHEASAEAELVVCAVGWEADVAGLQLVKAGVDINERGSVRVDEHMETTAPGIFAAGDVTGRLMLVPQAVLDGYVAGSNAAGGEKMARGAPIAPIGSFTDPEYAQVGMTEHAARERYDVVASVGRFDETTRPIVDSRTRGFCKLVIDRNSRTILGCHIVGERAVEVAQMAAIAMTGGMTVDSLARIPLSFPTYANVLGRAALRATRTLGLQPYDAT